VAHPWAFQSNLRILAAFQKFLPLGAAKAFGQALRFAVLYFRHFVPCSIWAFRGCGRWRRGCRSWSSGVGFRLDLFRRQPSSLSPSRADQQTRRRRRCKRALEVHLSFSPLFARDRTGRARRQILTSANVTVL